MNTCQAPIDEESARPAKSWIAVASAEHVRRGRAEGFMQVCHGKAAPLRRMRPGDRIAYYSPSTQFGGKDKLQSFTAVGELLDRAPYAFDMGGDFVPYRRDVAWQKSRELAIQPLLSQLEFSAGQKNWGYQLRFGLFEISEHDMALIAVAMSLCSESLIADSSQCHQRLGRQALELAAVAQNGVDAIAALRRVAA